MRSAKLYRRWRKALRNRSAGAGSKPPQAARVKSPGGERCGKRRKEFRQVWLKETNASKPLMTCRNGIVKLSRFGRDEVQRARLHATAVALRHCAAASDRKIRRVER